MGKGNRRDEERRRKGSEKGKGKERKREREQKGEERAKRSPKVK